MRYIYPPRPIGKTTSSDLFFFEKSGDWIVQRKYNGTRNLIYRNANGKISFFNRHGNLQSNFVPQKSLMESFKILNFEDNVEYVLDSELMNRSSCGNSFIVLFDILAKDKYLFNNPDQMGRLDILYKLCGMPSEETIWGYEIGDGLYLARFWEDNFLAEYENAIKISEIEGLMLRKKSSGLDNFGFQEYCTSTQVRCRRQKLNGYNF